ncbi:MAG: apolipoprotein N-acyltransferase, partial [Porticoccaceae bacterium]|nr:apolipoprotein N-acyltransferase [Porticoccaceae bacterium]
TLYPLSQAPFDWPAISLVSVAGLCLLLRTTDVRETFWRSFWYAAGLFTVGASWVYVSIHIYGEAPAPLAVALTGVFIVTLSLCFAAPFLLYGRLDRRHPLASFALFPSIWVLGEWFRGWFLTGFPWLYLGNSFIDTPLVGWAPLGGVLWLSWIGAATAAALATVFHSRGHKPAVLAALLTVCLFWLWAQTLEDREWTQPVGQARSVAMLQPAVPLMQKWDQNALMDILDLYSAEMEPLWQTDLVIWPESAIPELQHRVQPYLDWLDRQARRHDTTLITGIPTRRDGAYFNSVIALGSGDGRYDKRHLVPFGEYVPLEHWLRGTIRFFDLPMSTFTAGADRQPLLKTEDLRIATAICYEIVYQDMLAGPATEANILLTVSNDTWFGNSIGPHQHFQAARMRAMENAKPLLRATNDGISAIIDHRGKVTARVPQFQRTVLKGEITPREGSTPFNRWGSWPVLGLSLLFVAAGLLAGRRHGES